jgi:spermidine/putrescine transport system ATP-binding protein
LLEVRNVAKRFATREVLKGISLQIARGEFLTLLGESGSGKTTLLRLIAGFEQPSSGEIWMNGDRLDTLPPHQRKVNTVFQHYALFPHLNVAENVAYGLRATQAPTAEIPARVADALRMVKMEEYAATRPSKLSGGQQQRIALARALVNRPQLLLLDEPLSALDANLRKQMQGELKQLQRELGIMFRHPRSGRSHGPLRPHCASSRRRAGASRFAPRDLPAASHGVHGAVYRTDKFPAR